MRRQTHITFFACCWLVGLLGLGSACKKIPPPDPGKPVLELMSFDPLEMHSFDNNPRLVLKYTDYGGDVGDADPDIKSLSIKDSRLAEPDWFHIPPITPSGEEVPITGTFEVHLPALYVLGNGTYEACFFTLQLKDRAGNTSEEIITPTINIYR
ncbi:MAG: hypothetical protein AAFR61_04760 [Bacteroidota bacterium]